jgi:acyl CoA:acetate/3-ketoacid CoA transferase beta subunit
MGEAFLAFGLKAAAAGAPFFALPRSLAASDCARENPLYRLALDPYTGEEVLCVPALRPDWTLLHVPETDRHGNLYHSATAYMDPLLARASRRVLATADKILAEGAAPSPHEVTVPSILVRGVVALAGGARPAASPGQYDVDRREIRRFASQSKKPSGRDEYLATVCGPGSEEAAYLNSLGPAPAPPAPPAAKPREPNAPPSKGELIAAVVSRCVSDGMLTAAGTGCWEVAAGLRLAQLTHAPNLSFTVGGMAALNPVLDYLPISLNSAESLAGAEARVALEDLFDLELAGAFDVMFVSGLQIDAHGNLNLARLGPRERPAFRGPGTVGLEFAPGVRQLVAFFRTHTPQNFVERVDFISGFGYGDGPGSRSRWGLDETAGPKRVVTNLAVLDFCPETKRMRIESVHEGITVDQVRAQTGFELIVPDRVPVTAPPTEEELELLRTRIDRGGLLAGLVP